MPGSSAADRTAGQEIGRDEFDGTPMSVACQEMFGLGQEPQDHAFGSTFPGAFDGESLDVLPIASSGIPGMDAGMFRFGRQAAEGDEDFAFDPILGGPDAGLLEFADAEPLAIGQNAYGLHLSSEREGEDGVASFVIGGGFLGGRHRVSLRIRERQFGVSNLQIVKSGG